MFGATAIAFPLRGSGENIAKFYATPEAAVEGWMNSEGHRANILYEDDVAIGVGVVKVGDYWFWVTDHSTSLYNEADRGAYSDKQTTRTVYLSKKTNGGTVIADEDVEISVADTSIIVGATTFLSVKFDGPYALYDLPASGLVLSSSDESVATISEDGVITGVSPGTATIRAYFPGYEEGAKEFEVTVKSQEQYVEDDNAYADNGNVVISLNVEKQYSASFAILDTINDKRKAAGLEALTMDEELLTGAMQYAVEVVVQNKELSTRLNGGGIQTYAPNAMASDSLISRGTLPSYDSLAASFDACISSEDYTTVGIALVNVVTPKTTYNSYVVLYGTSCLKSASVSDYPSTADEIANIPVKSELTPNAVQISLETQTGITNSSISPTVLWKKYTGVNGRYTTVQILPTCVVGTSSDTSVCVVNDGLIQCVGAGTATVVLYVPGYEDCSYTVQITVERGNVLGDVTQDGIVTEHDAQALYRYCIGVDESSYGFSYDDVGDINGDGEVNSTDAQLLYRYVMGFDIQYDIGKTL
jgi:uncharacterized protein YkwD